MSQQSNKFLHNTKVAIAQGAGAGLLTFGMCKMFEWAHEEDKKKKPLTLRNILGMAIGMSLLTTTSIQVATSCGRHRW